MNQDLFDGRTQWYAAFVAGDTQCMAETESAEFIVIANQLVQDRATQIEKIATAKRDGHWFPTSSYMQNRRLASHSVTEDVIRVYGTGQIVTAGEKMQVTVFTELWKHDASGWYIVHLHYCAMSA